MLIAHDTTLQFIKHLAKSLFFIKKNDVWLESSTYKLEVIKGL